MRHFWPSDKPQKEKSRASHGKDQDDHGSCTRSRDYQTSPSPTCPTTHPSEKMKALKTKKMAQSYST